MNVNKPGTVTINLNMVIPVSQIPQKRNKNKNQQAITYTSNFYL